MTPPWFKTLKPSHAKAFSQDSDMVKEARREFFSKHSYDFTTDGTHDLSGTFRQLAGSADLLGTLSMKYNHPGQGPKIKTSELCFAIPTQKFEVSLCGTPFRIS